MSVLIGVFFISGPFILIYLLNNGNPYYKYLVNEHIPSHLAEAGYQDKDIESQGYSEPKHSINKNVYIGYYNVVFKDEPEMLYFYGVTKKGKNPIQFCGKHHQSDATIYENTKHSEENCIDQFDNR